MRSTSRGSKDPERYEDPLGMDEIAVDGDQITRVTPAVPVVVTGLSDEEDAARYVAKEFDKNLRFCANCEAYYDIEHMKYYWCPYCGGNLAPVGTKANKRKFASI